MTLSTHRQTFDKFLLAVAEEDYAALEAVLSDSPDFAWHFRPFSIYGHDGFSGFGKDGKANKEQFLAFMRQMPTMVKKLKLTDKPLHVVEQGDQLAIHTYAEGEAADGAPYRNEYFFHVTFEEKTGRLLEVVEFMDSAYILAFLSRFNASMPNFS
ncbi:hypothetical protein JCM10207_003577 [Rhodosporidiobolus poonsookiae]